MKYLVLHFVDGAWLGDAYDAGSDKIDVDGAAAKGSHLSHCDLWSASHQEGHIRCRGSESQQVLS